MREELARWIALLTVVVTVSLSALFAWVHNPLDDSVAPPVVVPVEAPESTVVHPGYAVFVAQRCTSCHSVAGEGSPRYPLDGVGARLDRDAILKWTIGAPELENVLPANAFRRKQPYGGLTEAELDALVSWLKTLRD